MSRFNRMIAPKPCLRVVGRTLGLLAPLGIGMTLRAQPPGAAARVIGAEDPASLAVPAVSGPELWRDPDQPLEVRVNDLERRLSLAEKASLLLADAAAIPRLGIPAYSFRNECIHGVFSTGPATAFPQVIGMAATWDAPLVQAEAGVIATEARAKFNAFAAAHGGDVTVHHGISFYAPNINIVRDPRWGRGQETYGEDPFLTSQFAVAFITGLQGDNPRYLEAMACAKHFAAHSGPEPLRRSFNATPPEADLYDTYLPAFEAAVRTARVGSVMGSYNAIDGVPDCANPFLLTDLLRRRWGFDGFVVSDGNAIFNLWRFHHYAPTPEAAIAAAVKAGLDLVSASAVGGGRANYPRRDYQALGRMLAQGLLPEADLDRAVGHTLAARFRLGLFDPPERVPWSRLTLADNDTPAHRALALRVAEESMVLLKNDGVLPLDRSRVRRIAVIGPNADAAAMLLGNYSGQPSRSVTILQGIRKVAGPDIAVSYAPGCPLALRNDGSNAPTPEMTSRAVALARGADVVVFVGGLNADLERENHPVPYQGFLGGDRTRIELPAPQEDLLRALQATGTPVIFVNCSGGAIAMPWEAEKLPAILQAWYPGEEGGLAVARVLFGDTDPAGRLPITLYRSTSDLPPFTDYAMRGRTYRYFDGRPLFAFGHGLSYTTFAYSHPGLDAAVYAPTDTARLSFDVTNTGPWNGDEVVQVYDRPPPGAADAPREALCAFARIHLARGGTARIELDIPLQRLRAWDAQAKRYRVAPGEYTLRVGAASDDIRFTLPIRVGPESSG